MSRSVALKVIGALFGLCVTYLGFAVSQTLPPSLNALCAVETWHSTFTSCMQLDPPPACDEIDPLDVVRTTAPHAFVQLYWQLVNCGQTEAAWVLQTPAYQQDNSGGSFANFQAFASSRKNFSVQEFRNVVTGPGSGGSSPATSSVSVRLVFVDVQHLNDIKSCWIDYILEQQPVQADGVEIRTWMIADTSSESGNC